MICFTITNTLPAASVLEQDILLLAQGDHEAMERIYRTTDDAVFAYALSLLKNSHDAEDVLHDCYVRLYRSADSYRPHGKPMAWLFTIARNLCMDRLRSAGCTTELPREDWHDYLDSREGLPAEDKIVLEACLEQLREDERELVILHAVAGLTHREIARMQHKPLSTVLSQYRRALGKLKALLGREEEAYA